MDITGMFGMFAFFSTIYGIVYLSIRKKERITAMTLGINPSTYESKQNQSLSAIKYGLLLIGVGGGVLIGQVLTAILPSLDPEVSYFSMICLGGGASLVFSYFLGKKYLAQQNKEV